PRGPEPNQDPRAANAAAAERTPRDRVLPHERENESDTRDAMRDVQRPRGGIGEQPSHDPRHQQRRDRGEEYEVGEPAGHRPMLVRVRWQTGGVPERDLLVLSEEPLNAETKLEE